MRKEIYIAGALVSVVDTRQADRHGAMLIARSKQICERDIFAIAPEHKQRNAALGLLSPEEISAITAHIAACRTTQNIYEAAVESILAGELDNAGKLVALDAL